MLKHTHAIHHTGFHLNKHSSDPYTKSQMECFPIVTVLELCAGRVNPLRLRGLGAPRAGPQQYVRVRGGCGLESLRGGLGRAKILRDVLQWYGGGIYAKQFNKSKSPP